MNHKRVERLWRLEGLKVPAKQPKRGRLWLNDGSCVRLRPMHKGHVWSYDFVVDRTQDGQPLRILVVMDKYTRNARHSPVRRSFKATDVEECLTELFCAHGVPEHLRSDNGSEFTATQLRTWINELGAQTLYIEPGSSWENGYIESFNGKLRDELLNREIFYTLEEAQYLLEKWRVHYNCYRQLQIPNPGGLADAFVGGRRYHSTRANTNIRSGTMNRVGQVLQECSGKL